MTRPGLEPQSPGPLANTLPTRKRLVKRKLSLLGSWMFYRWDADLYALIWVLDEITERLPGYIAIQGRDKSTSILLLTFSVVWLSNQKQTTKKSLYKFKNFFLLLFFSLCGDGMILVKVDILQLCLRFLSLFTLFLCLL